MRLISSPGKNCDKAAVVVSFALTLIGIAGIVVAVITLREVERQTKATEEPLRALRREITYLTHILKMGMMAYAH